MAEGAKFSATPKPLVKSPGAKHWPGLARVGLGTTPKLKPFGSKIGLSSPQASTTILGRKGLSFPPSTELAQLPARNMTPSATRPGLLSFMKPHRPTV